ncbi:MULTISPECIES: peptidase M14 [unclassified Achromobacter]|uniref:peptidase M14 n=1 Tax=unclassified Achromobacter TaxID=2626865 RepID=UPI000B518DDA|nr:MULTISPECIES: peptidase M14 [unclassified Achromobacter]OWT75550.1 peptidase M14 [Achromobacter sp. HZ28]OWT76211.1 peptidase M14 [Achromobacter sp. HZ34]
MAILLEQTFERTLDAWVQEFSDPAYRGARVHAWLFEGAPARRAAERRLAQVGVEAHFYSAYKPLVHFFLDEVEVNGLAGVTVRYPVHAEAPRRRFTLEAYPLVGMLDTIEVTFEPGGPQLEYAIELRYATARTEQKKVFAPNHVVTDHAGVVSLTPTGWVKVEGADGRVLLDEARPTEYSRMHETILRVVGDHPWGDSEPYFERLEIAVDLPGIERDTGYEDEVISTFEAMHEEIYFGLLEVFQRHSGRPPGNRGMQPGQIVPDVRQSEREIKLRIATESFAPVKELVARSLGTPLSEVNGPLSPERIAHEMHVVGGEPFSVRTRQGRAVLGSYVRGAEPAVVISGGQHANEASGVVGALAAAHVLKSRVDSHFVLIGLENPDGYALFGQLCQGNPRHMHHAARYTALGDDLAYREKAPYYELEARFKAYEVSGAQLHISLHGYPAHEWTRPLSGYLPRNFELWTVPKGYFLVLRHQPGWGGKARALMENITVRLAREHPELIRFNARQVALFQAHAQERGFDMLNGIPVQITESANERVPLMLISEFPDETVYGDRFRFAQVVQTATVLAAVDGYLNCVTRGGVGR